MNYKLRADLLDDNCRRLLQLIDEVVDELQVVQPRIPYISSTNLIRTAKAAMAEIREDLQPRA